MIAAPRTAGQWTVTRVCLQGGDLAAWSDMVADTIAQGDIVRASHVEMLAAALLSRSEWS